MKIITASSSLDHEDPLGRGWSVPAKSRLIVCRTYNNICPSSSVGLLLGRCDLIPSRRVLISKGGTCFRPGPCRSLPSCGHGPTVVPRENSRDRYINQVEVITGPSRPNMNIPVCYVCPLLINLQNNTPTTPSRCTCTPSLHSTWLTFSLDAGNILVAVEEVISLLAVLDVRI